MGQVFGKAGKYDDLAALVQREASADVVVLAVMGGKKGPGFSVAMRSDATAAIIATMPAILRVMADEIERGAPPSGMSEAPEPEGPPE